MTAIGPIRRDASTAAPGRFDTANDVLQGFKAHAGSTLRSASLPIRAQSVSRTEESFETRKARYALRIEGTPEAKLDGMFLGSDGFAYPADKFEAREVPAFRPADGRAPTKTSFYVNGIDSSAAQATGEAQRIADTTGAALVPVYNAREGLQSDILQATKDRMRVGKNKAADTLTTLVYDSLKAGKPIDLIGYSQGSAIVARSLDAVEKRLTEERGGAFRLLFHPERRDEVRNAMSKAHVTTFAGVDTGFPQDIKLEAHVNEKDPLPNTLGLHRPSWVDTAKGLISAFIPGAAIVLGENSPAPRDTKLHQFSEPAPGGDPHQLDWYLRHYERR